ncbi:LacI family DNA-binding transcriptional regulator [Kineococcus rhizosphaerae]|uniref:LacI family transcriptional regulator n=1 Tax=Kineococcus rhizosphaerae TaxID=559628 RepID=A0A2T0QUV3_9ACTN|nr:LacI family DNA-binding transcriptional regulator [Kineococcus rhizosphaerae]PRY08950.1 LacI family transcriptional regulator [Kineococcus rhizosphaerae]
MPKRVTLAEVARRAGVNKSTVSRALVSGGSSQVSGATAERIRVIATELGYLPDPAAASLRTGRSMVIGVLVPRVTDFVLASIYEGVANQARTHGYTTLVANSEDDPAVRLQQLDGMLSRRVDGVVIGDARLDGDEVVATLRRRSTPYVLVNRRLHGHPGVTTDDIRGGELAAEHLLQMGHRRVGILAGPGYASTGVERAHGFTRTYHRAGHDVPPAMIVESQNDADGGHTAARTLLLRDPEITAIFGTNDFAAIGAMGAAREAGRHPGVDLAVVGYNDIPLARYLPLPMTSVHSPIREMGQQGADLLIQQLAGGESELATLLSPSLEVRASSAVDLSGRGRRVAI